MSKLKKLLMVFWVVLCICSLIACGDGVGKSLENEAIKAAQNKVMARIFAEYNIMPVRQNITCNLKEKSGKDFEAYGKVKVHDEYGNAYTGKYNCELVYDDGSYSAINLEIGDMIRE